jgi:hypothetical protein
MAPVYYNGVDVTKSYLGSGTAYIGIPPGFSYDPDAQSFFNATGITNLTIRDAVNNLTVSLKDNGLWTSMSAIYPMVGGTADTHKYNLKDPQDTNAAYRITFSGSWTHSEASGSIPDGVAAGTGTTSGNTFYSASGAINDFSLSYYTRTNVMQNNVGGLFTFGVSMNSTQSYAIIINRTGVNLASNMGADAQIATFSYSNVAQRGLIVGSRTSSTSNKVYHNGTLRATVTSANTGTWPARAVHFGNPTSDTFTSMNCQFAHIGLGLTDAQVSTLSTIVEDFQDALGRGI